jgi:hypothetical protein
LKYKIDSLVVEVTRRCNMSCLHCLRGDPEAIDMKIEYMETLLDQVEYISSVTFTGGEPSLNITAIKEFIRLVREKDIEVGNFYIATNGREVSDEFLLTIMELYVLCTDNEVSAVEFSNDVFHQKVEEENIKKLEVFSFFNMKYGGKKYDGPIDTTDRLVAEGRGYLMGGSNSEYPQEISLMCIDNNMVEGTVYLNCEGNITNNCDISYESQREEQYIFCKVEDFTDSLEAVRKQQIKDEPKFVTEMNNKKRQRMEA